jgi:hypothetical protein
MITGKKDDGKRTVRAEMVLMKARTVVTLIYEGAGTADTTPREPLSVPTPLAPLNPSETPP